jgi:hypothetical protein
MSNWGRRQIVGRLHRLENSLGWSSGRSIRVVYFADIPDGLDAADLAKYLRENSATIT